MQIEVVNRGDTLWSISRKYGIDRAEIIRVNGLDAPDQLVAGQALVIPTSGAYYTVQRGDTMWSIANRFNVTVAALAGANNLSQSASLYPGQTLRVPERTKITIETNGYLQPASPEVDRRIVRETAEYLTYFSIFQYPVTKEGDLNPPSDQAALAAIKNTNAVPMMVISNFEKGNFSSDIARAVFSSTTVRDRLINNVLTTIKKNDIKILNIDFEHIYPADRERYNQFLRTITARMHNEGIQVSTALAPKESAKQVGQWYEAHDYAAHGQIVDFVIIMTYEWGWSGGPPMAVAPIPQVRKVLEYALTVIPHNKIIMGAPLYGYDWTLPFVPGGKFARSIGPQDAIRIARQHGAAIQYDYTSRAPYFHYWDSDGKQHVVWFEDARTIQAKFDLIRRYRLRGISYWVLGNPSPQNWALLKDNFNIRKL